MRIVNLPPDTKGVGTPESEIKDPNGRIMGYFDNIDKLRLRLARWLHINGRLDDFMGQAKLTKDETIEYLSQFWDCAEGIDDVPEWHYDDRYYGLNFAQPEYLRNFYRSQLQAQSDDCPF